MGGLLVAGFLPLAGMVLLPLLVSPRSRWSGRISTAIAASSFFLILLATPGYLEAPGYWSVAWIRPLGLNFSLLADGISLTFALLISGIGAIVFGYAQAYLGEEENRLRFFSYMLLFMASMLGLVLSANLIVLFVFWELTSVSSFLLIGFWHDRERSRNGAFKALVITSSGGLAMLVGFVMIGVVCGSFEIPQVLARRSIFLESPWALPATALILVGVLSKSAQAPFHLWLPSAMEAPTPVSAYLHAATMVKAGLYLVARLGPLLGGVPLWTPILVTVGLATMAWGSWLALRQKDLKALLAMSTVSQLGLILVLLGIVRPAATAAGLLHLINHGAFKGALFLLVGAIEHETRTRDLMRLGPLARSMPKTFFLLAVAALSMAGVPPLGGFVSKELFLEQALRLPLPFAAVALGGAALTAAYCLSLVLGLRRGRGARQSAKQNGVRDAPASLLWGPALLVAVTVLLGLFPQQIVGRLVQAAAVAAQPGGRFVQELAPWHGLSVSLLASAAVLAAGLALYFWWWRTREPDVPVLLSDRIYDRCLQGMEGGAKRLTAAYMSGLLWRYNAIILGVATAGIAAMTVAGGLPRPAPWPSRDPQLFDFLVAAAACAAGVAAARARTRLAAILALGASGYTLALLFSTLGAPDLALTQVMVETVSVALFLAVFVFLPPYHAAMPRHARPGHLALSCAAGFGAAALVHLARSHRVAGSIARYFLDHSVHDAGGHNVVNVILVDFRGLDTLGEITVLAVAALACVAIIRARGVSERS